MIRRFALRLLPVLSTALVVGCGGPRAPHIRQIDQARVDYDAGRYNRCEKTLDAYIRRHPTATDAAEAYYLRGLGRIRQGHRASAKRDIQTAYNLARDRELKATIAVQLGNLDFDDERYAGARNHYTLALADLPSGEPPTDKALYRLAVSQFRLARFADGRATLSDLVRRFPNSPLAPPAKRLRNWPGDYFTVQCGAFSDRSRAQRSARRLRRHGFHALTLLDPAANRHVVRVGRFRTYRSARTVLNRIRRYQPDAFILP